VDLYHSPLFTCPIVREVPSVITIHDVIPESRPDLWSQAFLDLYRSCIGPAIRAAEWVVTTSEFSKRETVERLGVPAERVRVVYQGISEDWFSGAHRGRAAVLRERLGLPERYILYVGMLDRRKNVERLILAFGRRAKDLPGVHLVIVGRKDEAGYSVEPAIGACGAGERVRQLGYVPDEDLPALVAGARAFAFVSLYEGFGRPVVEAMACGVPVLASSASSLPEIAGDAAYLADPEDVDAIAEGLERICSDDNLRARLKERGSVRAREFTHRRFGERLVEFYDRVEGGL
jgi:glycosyltransferase involved in cell wall biosynthesis